MAVTGAPLWSPMTRVIAPSATLLTVTRPSFPAERITWPAGGEDGREKILSCQKKSYQSLKLRDLIERNSPDNLNSALTFENWMPQMNFRPFKHWLRLWEIGIYWEESSQPRLYLPWAEYWMAEMATWWGCSFISISEEASRKILSVPSLYPAATQALSSLEKGLQHTQLQPWNTEQEAVLICSVCTWWCQEMWPIHYYWMSGFVYGFYDYPFLLWQACIVCTLCAISTFA